MKSFFSIITDNKSRKSNKGITILEDNGIPLNELKNSLPSIEEFTDYVRLRPSFFISKETTEDRIRQYKNVGVNPFVSGELFEYAFLNDKLEEYDSFLKHSGTDYIEISDSISYISSDEKADFIDRYTAHYKVFNKIGTKISKARFRNKDWKAYLDNKGSAFKTIIEGSNAGALQFINFKPEVRQKLISFIEGLADASELIWEAPYKEQQIWLIQHFGSEVNLANINIREVLDLESLRNGADWETMKDFIPKDKLQNKVREIDPLQDIDYQI
ncbi:MAG: phosphosulfolactate synthase [Bacteroidota bacterium]